MAPISYRFTITVEYVDQNLGRYKKDFEKQLKTHFQEYKYEFDENLHKNDVTSFWVNVALPEKCNYVEALFDILLQFQEAVGDSPMTVSLTSNLVSSSFSCADTDMVVEEVKFGLLRTPFEFQSICTLYPNSQKQKVNVHRFELNRSQIYLINFYHDRGVWELLLPMRDRMDKLRRDVAELAKNGGSDNVNKMEQLKAILKGENDPHGKRHEKNEVVVRLPYENIKTFVYDVNEVVRGYIKGTINIIYEHPPEVHVAPLSGRDGDRSSRAERYVRWSHNFSIDDFLKPMVYASAVKFDVVIPKAAFYNLMVMLRVRLQCAVSFRKVWPATNTIDFALQNTKFPTSWPFEVQYLIECILSRGVSGQKFILSNTRKYREICKEVSKFLQRHDINGALEYLTNIFYKVLKDDESTSNAEFEREVTRHNHLKDENYMNVRKAVITPTRVLYYPPESIMGCRLLRNFGESKFLRVIFRDDTMDNLHNIQENFINDTIMKHMEECLEVGGKKFYYLGYSNSQLRDQGCYFMQCERVEDLMKVYSQMGEFKKEGVAKTMARFAQCFTQSYPSRLKVSRDRVAEIPDFTNGARNRSGDEYCFSDGVGCMSLAKAKELQQELQLPWTPSCYQFRYAGYKGVLSVNPFLDDFAAFITKSNKCLTPKNAIWTKDILFRPSQNKFIANEEHKSFEIVKYSSSGVVCLNKQLINIYDQVGSKQSSQCHSSIMRRILQLTDLHIDEIMKSLTSEVDFKLALRELPLLVPYRQLSGFSNIVDEAFFRRLVLARARCSLKFLGEKLRISVPANVARNMFGIVDETGQLQYGQVFIQYSVNIHDKAATNKDILTGSVMITKNPMMNGGDLRKFDAINIPALWHLNDVVVFSQYGPRPSPDEMAGSDLDGDEYCVIWDPELMLDFNEEATDYSAPKQTPVVVPLSNLRGESVKFFKNYLLNDGIGMVANAHLANSDLFGLDSDVCSRIAKKQIAAVDFAKSGIPMEPLVSHWMGDEPPERIERYPDFMRKTRVPCYQSNRLLGHVYRKIQRFVDSVSAFIEVSDDAPVVDEAIHMDGWEQFEQEASIMYARYREEIGRLLITFGIKNEAELLSQCFTDIKNKQLKNQEADNLSGFSTASLIQKHIQTIWVKYRKEFFATARINFTDVLLKGEKAFLQTRLSNVLDANLRRRAVAYYKVAYRKGDIISFPWVVWDVLDSVRLERSVMFDPDPLGSRISAEIESKKFDKYNDFINIIRVKLSGIIPYVNRYDGLGNLLYFLCKWRDEQITLANVSKTEVIVMFMKYATGQLFRIPGVMEFLSDERIVSKPYNYKKIDLRRETGGLGRILLAFFVELSRDTFLDHTENWLTVPDFGCNRQRNEDFCDIEKWQAMQHAARDTYYTTVFQSSPSILQTDAKKGFVQRETTVVFGEAFTIEVLENFKKFIDESLMRSLCDLSGCTHIALRFPETYSGNKKADFRIRATLWPKGTPDAINRLRDMLTISAPINRNGNAADIVYLMKHNMTQKLLKLCNNVSHA